MERLIGTPIGHGVVYAPISICLSPTHDIKKEPIKKEEIDFHINRFHQSLDYALAEIDNLLNLVKSAAADQRTILRSHQEMLKDAVFAQDICQYITTHLVSADTAVYQYFEKMLSQFSAVNDSYIAQRKEDIRDVRDRILGNMAHSALSNDCLSTNTIAVFREITPSLIFQVKQQQAKGLIVEKGSATSHSAIIAKSIGLPVVFNIPDAFQRFHQGELVILNGNSGEITLQPSPEEIHHCKQLQEQEKLEAERIVLLSKLPPISADGYQYRVMCNLEFPEEANNPIVQNGDGVGLFRTEFLYYLDRRFPEVAEQVTMYNRLATSLGSHAPVYVRTFDIGGDKLQREFQLDTEKNPNLGCRGIRFSLRFPQIFRAQLSALMQCEHADNLHIMLPMVTTVDEIYRTREIINAVATELKEKNISINVAAKLGTMIETPAAALAADHLAKEVDFFSIGTNDLTQYILAADRNNTWVSSQYTYFHPSVLELLERTIQAAKDHHIPVSICGEMAGDPVAIPLLMGMGLTTFSVVPELVLQTKQIISIYSVLETQEWYSRYQFASEKTIKDFYMQQYNKRVKKILEHT